MLQSKKTKRTIWNNGLGKYDMLTLYHRIIGAVSSSDTSVVLVWHGYVGHVQVCAYHRSWIA